MTTSTATATEQTLFRFTREQYHRLAEAGILPEDSRVELLEGQIIHMSPVGKLHAACVRKLDKLLQRLMGDQALVSVQNPIAIGTFSEPQPDLALLKPKEDFYAGGHPRPEDVLLLIEVADSSLNSDKENKIPFYGRAGITECWLIDITNDRIIRYTEPSAAGYQSQRLFLPEEKLQHELLGEVGVRELLL